VEIARHGLEHTSRAEEEDEDEEEKETRRVSAYGEMQPWSGFGIYTWR
jgi:hypothetical protein